MIPKISKGPGFYPTLRYVFRLRAQDKDVDRSLVKQVAGSVWEEDIRELIKQFESTRIDKPNIKSPVWHCSLSVRKEEGRLGPQTWQEIAEAFMKSRELKFPEGLSWVAVWHGDKAHDHIHIVASRIAFGKVWDDKRDMLRVNKATARLEREFNLLPTLKTRSNATRKISDEDFQMALRRGVYPPRRRLQIIIDKALEKPTSYASFVNFLVVNGVLVFENRASTGKLNGLSFKIDDIYFKGSHLGKSQYSLSNLIRRGGLYGYENYIGGDGQEGTVRNQDTRGAADGAGASLSSTLYHDGPEGDSWYGRNLEGVHEGLGKNQFDIVSDDGENGEAASRLHKLVRGYEKTDHLDTGMGSGLQQSTGNQLSESCDEAESGAQLSSGQRGKNPSSDRDDRASSLIGDKGAHQDGKVPDSTGKEAKETSSGRIDSGFTSRPSDGGGHRPANHIPLSGPGGNQPLKQLGGKDPCRGCPTPDDCDFCSFKHLRKKFLALQKGGHTR